MRLFAKAKECPDPRGLNVCLKSQQEVDLEVGLMYHLTVRQQALLLSINLQQQTEDLVVMETLLKAGNHLLAIMQQKTKVDKSGFTLQ